MSFATSSAAFGIKPSSSSTPFGTSAFGQGQNQANATNAFGQPLQPQISTGNLGTFGGGATNVGPFGGGGTNQPNALGIFGGTNPSANQPATNTFGNSNAPTNTQFALGTLGQPNQTQSSAPAFGGGSTGSIFGNTTNQQNQQTTGGATGGSLFGNFNQQQNQPLNAGGFLGATGGANQPQSSFGGALQNQPQTSIFGNLGGQQQNQTNQPQTSINAFTNTQPKPGGFFGGGISLTQPQMPNQTNSLWGNTGGATMNSSMVSQPHNLLSNPLGANQQQQAVLPFSKTTKFNDLPEQAQKVFESIDAHIQGRIQISKDIKSRSLDEEPRKAAETIRKIHVDVANTLSTLQGDKAIVEEIRAKSDQSVQDAITTTRIIDGFKNPQQNGTHLKNHATFPFEFFNRAAQEIREKLQWYKSTIEQIERRLVSAQNQAQYNPQVIVTTLQAQNSIFIALAGKTAELDALLQKLKAQYRELWRIHTGSARDPFNELDRRPRDGDGFLNGLGSLNLNR